MRTSAPELSFTELRERKRNVTQLCARQLEALQRFHSGADLAGLRDERLAVTGFSLNPDDTETSHLSISSTATCIRSLMASPAVGDRADFAQLLAQLHERYEASSLRTRGLKHGNAYTLGQLLPTLRRMVEEDTRPALITYAVRRLRDATKKRGVRLEDFPANGYLTYWALVALDAWDALRPEDGRPSLEWSRDELYRQLALFGAEDDEADPYQLGYNLLVQRRFEPEELKDSVLEAGLRALFGAQLPTGVWEKKEPLFRYGEHGDAHPYSFELLNALLADLADSPKFLSPHEEHLERAVAWAERNAYGAAAPTWRSGHLATNREPESWATAEVYYFLQNYRTYLAERILGGVMRESGRAKPARPPEDSAFGRLYQPSVQLGGEGEPTLLGDLVIERMLAPLELAGGRRRRYTLARNPLRKRLLRSGIFFGPPGTGKTTYAEQVAAYLGWPLLTLTPADFAAEGMLLIPTVGRRLFDRLLELEDTVIFFDEMEELIPDRTEGKGTFEERFLTTSFLPALQELRDTASCIYLVATNNFKRLDPAARAPRRFDFQVQVRPPAIAEKLRLLERDYASANREDVRAEVQRAAEKVGWATLRETRGLYDQLQADPDHARRTIEAFEPALASDAAELETEAAEGNFFGGGS